MKRVIAIVMLLQLFGCAPKPPAPEPGPPSRIKVLEARYLPKAYIRISIVSVDGIEYLVNDDGGIIRHTRPDTCISRYPTSWHVTDTGVVGD